MPGLQGSVTYPSRYGDENSTTCLDEFNSQRYQIANTTTTRIPHDDVDNV